MPQKIMSDDQIRAVFGWPSFVPIDDSTVRITDGWDTRNIVRVFVPQLAGVPTYGGNFGGNVRFHKVAAPQLVAGMKAVELKGLASKIIFWDGSYNPRRIRGSNKLSRHALGLAFDVNGSWNPFHKPVAKRGEKGSLHEVAEVLDRFGFAWGGTWTRLDGMHFEVGKVLTATEIQSRLAEFGGAVGGVQLLIDGVRKDVTITIRDGVSFATIGQLAAAIGKTAGEGASTRTQVAQYLKANGYDVRWDGNLGPAGSVIAVKA